MEARSLRRVAETGARADAAPAPTVVAEAAPPAPMGHRVATLLARADGELVAAQLSSEPWEVFSHAHLAALRAAGALVEASGPVAGRRGVRTVWGLLELARPDLSDWAQHFAAAAGLRAAVDAGRFSAVSPQRAQDALGAAQDFVETARRRLEGDERPGTAVPLARGGGTLARRRVS